MSSLLTGVYHGRRYNPFYPFYPNRVRHENCEGCRILSSEARNGAARMRRQTYYRSLEHRAIDRVLRGRASVLETMYGSPAYPERYGGLPPLYRP